MTSYGQIKHTVGTYQEKNTKANTYILQDEDEYYNWDHTKMGPIKTVVKTKNEKSEEIINIERDYRGEEDAQNTINSISLEKQDNQVKQYHQEGTEKISSKN